MFQVKSCFSSEKLIQTSLYTLTIETGKVLPKETHTQPGKWTYKLQNNIKKACVEMIASEGKIIVFFNNTKLLKFQSKKKNNWTLAGGHIQ